MSILDEIVKDIGDGKYSGHKDKPSTERGQGGNVDECVCVDLRETIDGMKCQKCGKIYSEALGSGDASVLAGQIEE